MTLTSVLRKDKSICSYKNLFYKFNICFVYTVNPNYAAIATIGFSFSSRIFPKN